LIDGNGIQWRAYHSKGIDDGALRKGIFGYIFALLWKFKPDEILIFWDISKSRWRRDYFKSYKLDREEKQKELPTEEIYRQVDEAKSYLSRIGLRNIAVKGLEADDLISWFSEYYSRFLNKEVVIVSGDKDLWQLINDNAKVYDYLRERMITPNEVSNDMGVAVSQIAPYTALVGDSSDEIPGVKGIGPKTAAKLISDYGGLDKIYQISN
jgi:DNA polymerase-1